jgi:N utilization substance protein A
MKSLKLDQLTEAIQSLSTERNVPEETIFKAVESAFAAAWRRDKGERGQDVSAKFNINTGELEIYTNYEVVEKDEDIEDDLRQLLLEDAKKIDKAAKVGSSVQQQQDVPEDFGRIAAQTAKQAIIQSLKESESEIMVEEYKDRVGTVINGSIQRVESRFVRVDLGRTSAIMPREEQIPGERYNMGERLKFYIKEIDDEGRIPTMIVSRSAPELVVALFKQEVPEIGDGAVQIKGIARSAGLRTKVSVFTDIPGVDAAGTLIGGHGVRVKAVNAEVGETERIDIVEYSDNLAEYITRAMSPAKIDGIKINEENKTAQVFVSEDEVRIAIGRGGANVRLAGQLTGCEIEVERPEPTETPEDEKKDSKTSEKSEKEEAPRK